MKASKCRRYEVCWDRKVDTLKALEANRPRGEHWTIIDFSVPDDVNVENKEREKVEKYTPLAYEVRKM